MPIPTFVPGGALPPEWMKTPQQARSQDTLARLLDTAEQLLEESPWESISVATLVSRARSSVGSFYSRFPDKDALLQHLHARRCAEAIQTAAGVLARERWHGVKLTGVVQGIVSATVHDYAAHAGFHREMVRRNCIDARFRQRSADVASQTTRLVAALLEDRRAEMRVADTLAAADMMHRILFSVLDQHVQFFDRGPGARSLTNEQLIDELSRALLGYLDWQP